VEDERVLVPEAVPPRGASPAFPASPLASHEAAPQREQPGQIIEPLRPQTQDLEELDDDFDLDELLLRLTGHKLAGQATGTTPRLLFAQTMSLSTHPSPAVVAGLPSAHQFPESCVAEAQVPPPFPSPVLPPALPSDIVVNPFTPFDSWAVLTGTLPPQGRETSLGTDGERKPVPARSGRSKSESESESFEIVSLPPASPSISVSAIDGAGNENKTETENGHVEAHAWWNDFAQLKPLFSALPPPQCSFELEPQDQAQVQVAELAEATSLQVQIEPVVVKDPGPGPVVSQQLPSPPFPLPLLHPSHQHATEKCPCPFCASPTKSHQRKRKAVVIDEDTAHVANGTKNGDGNTAHVSGKRPGKRRKSEPSKPAKPRASAKRTKEPSRRKRGAKAKEEGGGADEPVRERWFATTDERGRLKMLPLRTRATQQDKKVGSSANAHPQLPPLPPPRLKPITPRRILPQPAAEHPRHSPSTHCTGTVTPAPRVLVPVVPTVPLAPVSVPQRRTKPMATRLNDPPSHPHPSSHVAPSVPAPAPGPPRAAAAIGPIIAPLPRYAASYNHLESWDVGFMDTEMESEPEHPLPIHWHQHQYQQTQSCTLGAVVVDTHIQAHYQQQVYPEYCPLPDSINVQAHVQAHVQAQAHAQAQAQAQAQGCYYPKPAPAPAPAPLPLASHAHIEMSHSQYYHLAAQQETQSAARQALQGQAVQSSLMHAVAVPPVEPNPQLLLHYYPNAPHHQPHQPQPSHQFMYAYDVYQNLAYPALYSQHPEASSYAQLPFEPLYAAPYAHDPYGSRYYQPYV
jgi:hypothetical protein